MVDNIVEIHLEVLDESDAAYKVTDGDAVVWVPKSEVEPANPCEIGDTEVFEVPEWLAVKKGFV